MNGYIFNRTVSIEICRLSIKCLTLAEYNYSLYYNTAKKLPNGYPRPPLPLPPFYHSVGTGMDLIVRYLFLAVTRGVTIQNPKKKYPPLLITVSSLSYILQNPLSFCQYHIHLVTSGLLELT